jgi:hypothetical protein
MDGSPTGDEGLIKYQLWWHRVSVCCPFCRGWRHLRHTGLHSNTGEERFGRNWHFTVPCFPNLSPMCHFVWMHKI